MASATAQHRLPAANGIMNGAGEGAFKHAQSHLLNDIATTTTTTTEQFPAFADPPEGDDDESGDSSDDEFHDSEEDLDHSSDNGPVTGHRNGKVLVQRPTIVSNNLSAMEPAPEPHTPDRATTVTSPITSPPYWAHGDEQQRQLQHTSGNMSTESLPHPGAITLQDNEADDDDDGGNTNAAEAEARTSYGRDRNRACWAKSVAVTDYVTVNGSATNIGAFVVWNIRVETLSGPFMNIRKRYSEFDDFRRQLIRTFPNFEAAVPVLPPKSLISKFRPRFLEKRRAGLQYFLNCILLNPEFSGSPVLKDFLFS